MALFFGASFRRVGWAERSEAQQGRNGPEWGEALGFVATLLNPTYALAAEGK
jgi:hypothetical protein